MSNTTARSLQPIGAQSVALRSLAPHKSTENPFIDLVNTQFVQSTAPGPLSPSQATRRVRVSSRVFCRNVKSTSAAHALQPRLFRCGVDNSSGRSGPFWGASLQQVFARHARPFFESPSIAPALPIPARPSVARRMGGPPIAGPFAALADPRRNKVKCPLINTVFIAISAVISGGDNYLAIANVGQKRRRWL